MTLLKQRAQFVLSIESNNTGSAIISDLNALNSMYKLLIYRNTIGPDIRGKTDIKYYDCKYGIELTGSGNSDKDSIRDILMEFIFNFVNKNLECIKSKYLITEIESLETDKNGKIVGNPHDDSVFALGHCLLVKYRGRQQNIQTIFNSCAEILQDGNYNNIINLSLSNYDDEIINDALQYSNNLMNDQIIVGETGLNATIMNNFQNNNDMNFQTSLTDQLNFFNNTQLTLNSTGQISSESLNMLRESISQQTKIIQDRVRMQKETEELLNIKYKNNPLINELKSKKNKKETKKEKLKKILKGENYLSSSDLNYIPQYNDSDEYINFVFG